jgi:hypothetical protein
MVLDHITVVNGGLDHRRLQMYVLYLYVYDDTP